MVRVLISFFICLVAVPSLGREARAGFDTNDVSLLFPIANSQIYPKIKLSDVGHLISSEVFEAVLKFEYPALALDQLPYADIRQIKAMDRWLITSLRYDPCGDVFHTTPITASGDRNTSENSSRDLLLISRVANQCQPRLRIVAQPTNPFGQPYATAIHLITKLNSHQNQAVITKLQSIKAASLVLGADTNQKTLAPHPGLLLESRQSGSPVISRLLKSLLEENIALSDLEIVTLILTVQARQWKFVGGYLDKGTWVRMVTPLMQELAHQSGYLTLGIESLQCNFYDICTSAPQNANFDAQLLTGIFKPGRAKRPVDERSDEQTTRLAELTDGAKVDFFSTNCTSCHQSSNYRNHQLLYDSVSSFVPGITPFVERTFLGYSPSSVINFGYDGKQPRIATRTAFESSLAAQRTNLALGQQSPGYVPNSVEDFWVCLLNSGSPIIDQRCFTK